MQGRDEGLEGTRKQIMGLGGNAGEEEKKNHFMQARGGRQKKRREENEMESSSGLLRKTLIIDDGATEDVRQRGEFVGLWCGLGYLDI